MILYNVTVNVETDVEQEWLQWMKSVHIPKVLSTGYFLNHRILKLLTEVENSGSTYSIQYFLPSLIEYKEYANQHAPSLQREHSARYEGKFVAFRTLLEILE